MDTVVKNVKQHSKYISNVDELSCIAKQYTIVKNYVYSRYSGINSLLLLNDYKKKIRDIWVKNKFAEQWKLPARYWKLALDEAISNIKSEWSNTKNRIKIAVSNNQNIIDDEKYFIYYILKSDDLLYRILKYKEYTKPDKIAKLSIREHYILNLIRRYIRKYKGNIAHSHKARSFMIDADMYQYKFNGNILSIEIMGLIRNKRISVVLSDKNIHKGNLRIILNENGSLEIHKAKNTLVCKNEAAVKELAIDKGYTTLFVTSEKTTYGDNLNNLLSKETERLNKVNAKRNRVWALMNEYKNDNNFKKFEIIRKSNLGKVKYNKNKKKFDEQVKSYINHEIDRMIALERPYEIILENLNFSNWNKKYPKHIKRKLSRWIKGYIQKRLEYKCSLKDIKITMINPAYTSQVCHKCGAFGKRNSKMFICIKCGTVDADYNASVNIKLRKYDKEISLYTPYKKVKQILLNRYNAAIVA